MGVLSYLKLAGLAVGAVLIAAAFFYGRHEGVSSITPKLTAATEASAEAVAANQSQSATIAQLTAQNRACTLQNAENAAHVSAAVAQLQNADQLARIAEAQQGKRVNAVLGQADVKPWAEVVAPAAAQSLILGK